MSMTCPECTKEILAYPCKCGYTPKKPPKLTPCRETYRQMNFGPSREEFGLALFATIGMIGGLLGIEQQRAAAIHHGHGYKLKSLQERRDALRVMLAGQLPTLKNDEMDQILEKYPFVTGW